MEFKDKAHRSIVLVGTGGAGKTTIGQLLAEGLGYEFVDSDEVIIDHEQCSIADIFEKQGEAYFRDLEQKVIKELIESETSYLIGTGGGAFINDVTRDLIKEQALSVFLKADLEVLLKRVGNGEGRPLLMQGDTEEILGHMIEKRYPIYEEADLIVETKDEPLEETLGRVTEALYNRLQPA